MKRKKVLVVDDEVHIVYVVAIKLRNNGFEVSTAANGAEALEIVNRQLSIDNQLPDIIVTDFQMPVMTGLELVEKLRSSQTTKDIPVIMLTARNFAIADEQKEALRISELLSKPFSPKELLRSIEDILSQNARI